MTSTRQGISIIIPCYNQGRFLREAVQSALEQTHSAAEVIVVDDGSTDDTAAVTLEYPAVRLLQQPNRGAAAARNRGLRESRGEYVVFLDADDRLLPDAAMTGMHWLITHPEWAFATGHVRGISHDGSPVDLPPQDHAHPDPYVELLRSNYIWTPGVVMYRRSTFDTVRPFDAAAGGSADYELNIRIAREFRFGCHHQVILEYRRHGANMSADAARMLRSAVRVRRSQRRYVRSDPVKRAAWEAGIREVQADFGGQLIDQISSDLGAKGRRGRAFRGFLCLIRFYPAGLARVVKAVARRLLRLSALRL